MDNFVEHLRDFPGGGPKGLNRLHHNGDILNADSRIYSCIASRTFDQFIPSGSAGLFTKIAFDVYDDGYGPGFPGSGISENGFQVPAGFSFVKFNANLSFSSDMTEFYAIYILRNGSITSDGTLAVLGELANSTPTTVEARSIHIKTPWIPCAPGDYFHLWFRPPSAVTLLAGDASNGRHSWFAIEGNKTP